MKKAKFSLRTGVLAIIVTCWLVPVLIIVTFSGVVIGNSYEQAARQEMDASAQYALRQIESGLESMIGDSKAVSYDGIVRTAYRAYQQSGNNVLLYRSVSDYLAQNYSRAENYKAVFISFLAENVNADVYVYGAGDSGAGILQICRDMTPRIVEIMAEADTEIRFLVLDGQLYMARNLLDSHFEPYASIVMLLEPEVLFQPLSAIGRAEDIRLQLDDAVFSYDAQTRRVLADESTEPLTKAYETAVDGHRFSLELSPAEYRLWAANPWLRWTVAAVALMVLPLLAVIIVLFRRHVSKPVETLAQANLMVQEGKRGFRISDTAPNTEFEKLYSHFNDMSAEMKRQFERAYLEQQASQRAQIKALQSQINPHFLNNTLEIINWEARMSGNDRVGAMIEALSTMLDAALDRGGRTQIPLKEELGYVDAYLYIIRERLGEGFVVHKAIDETLLEQPIPRLILQPIVENAVEHDITQHRGGNLWVRAGCEAGQMRLEVEHDGTMTGADREKIRQLLSDEDTSETGSVGIRNVYQRLKLIYGEAGSLSVTETAHGTILAQIGIPTENGREAEANES